DATFTPTEKKDATYTANFKEVVVSTPIVKPIYENDKDIKVKPEEGIDKIQVKLPNGETVSASLNSGQWGTIVDDKFTPFPTKEIDGENYVLLPVPENVTLAPKDKVEVINFAGSNESKPVVVTVLEKPVVEEYVTVTFDTNGGSEIAPIKVQKGKTVAKPEDPTKEGLKFARWELDGKEYDFNTPVEENITLKAVWSRDLTPIEPIEMVTVTFDTNGGSEIAPVKVQKGKTVAKPEDPIKENYTFIEWQKDGKKYDFTTPVIENITLNAVFKENEVTVKYVSNDTEMGTVDPAEETVKVVTGELQGSRATAEKGYEFVNWTDESGKEVSKDATFTPTEKKDATYTANFKKLEKVPEEIRVNFVIKESDKDKAEFVANEAGGINNSIVFPKGKDAKEVEAQAPKVKVKDGYEFKGWTPAFEGILNEDTTYTAVIEKVKVKPTPDPTPSVPEPTPAEPKDIVTDRTKGKDRIETAIEISKKYYGQADTVIIVDKANFPDAMTASVLAKLLKAPILLTNSKDLDSRVAAEINRLGARDIIIVGGRTSVSEEVKTQLGKFDKDDVERIYGGNRYETSAQVARRVVGITGKLGTGVVASGEVFADALTVGPFASREGFPILLVKSGSVPGTIKNAIDELAISRVYIAGGSSSVSSAATSQLPTVVETMKGSTRYETAIDIAKKQFPNAKSVFVANGQEWADALVIAPVGGLLDMPILLTKANDAPKTLVDYIRENNIEKITAIGGRSMVSEKVLSDLAK
ncbi:cell wall-binding repeat-containing protein, partial [Lagierella sp.]|uniref:cell wall-binding repeat-containing protein n=1 Tax=Lagierella sp. TaxID=2849657 RepID=UPI002633A386